MNRRIFSGSKVNRDRRDQSFERAVVGEAWRRHLAEQAVRQAELDRAEQAARDEEQPLGECLHCGTEYFTESEREYHAEAECVGGRNWRD